MKADKFWALWEKQSYIPLLKVPVCGMNAWGAKWLSGNFTLQYTILKMTFLLYKIALVNFPMATTVCKYSSSHFVDIIGTNITINSQLATTVPGASLVILLLTQMWFLNHEWIIKRWIFILIYADLGNMWWAKNSYHSRLTLRHDQVYGNPT